LDQQLVRLVWNGTEIGTRRLEEAITQAEELYEAIADADRRDFVWNELVVRTRELANEAEEQLKIPATLLVGDQALPFAEADRVRAEAELRIGVSLPLMALAFYLSGWWLLLLLAALALLWQGLLHEDTARQLIVQTIIHKDVPFTPFDKFREAVVAASGRRPSAAPSE
jgi:hypothetical protein